MRILQQNLKRTTDIFLFISHTTNVLLFKFRCNIFIGVRIIKEMPGSVASRTPFFFATVPSDMSQSQWSRGLRTRTRSATARLLRLWVRIPPGSWMSVCCECCVLSGRGLCDGLITRPEESYQVWCVVVCDLETSWMRRFWPSGGCHAKTKPFDL
jgi:hypothetical protein